MGMRYYVRTVYFNTSTTPKMGAKATVALG